MKRPVEGNGIFFALKNIFFSFRSVDIISVFLAKFLDKSPKQSLISSTVANLEQLIVHLLPTDTLIQTNDN